MSGRLDGQVALVTGGARGIGLAISHRLLGQGATVAAGYSRDDVHARALLDANPGRVSIHQGNIGVVEDCNRVVAEVTERHGKIDILVNNAGITADHTVRKMDPDEWDRVVRVNLSGAFYLTHAVLNPMIERGYGRIVNISSVIGETGNIGQANYSAAKSGLFGLTKTLALETARQGHHRELRRTRLHRDGDGDGGARGRPGEGDRPYPGAGAWASRRRWRGWSTSWSTRTPATSPARSWM